MHIHFADVIDHLQINGFKNWFHIISVVSSQ
jgi:hypothetical protein